MCVDGAAALASWSIETRVRSAATALATAAIVNVALLWLVSPYAAPGIPRGAVVVAAVFAAAVARWPRPFIEAWSSSVFGSLASSVRRFVYKPAE